MKENLAIIVAILAIIAAVLFTDTGGRGVVYDCGMAEWHPDIPNVVKEECRKRALEYWREQQERISKEKTTI